MTRPRSFLWLVALIAFVVPSLGMAQVGHAAARGERTVSADCPQHAPPPDPCPAKGTAKHAAGECCPLMASVLALLPQAAGGYAAMSFRAPIPQPAHSLVGRIFTKDPPPPRV
ncbi:MAG: hypothetical protein ACXWK3_18795 [Reyranella sp.]